MSIQYAQDIVNRLGPGRLTLDRSLYADLACELALIGCEVHDLTDAPVGGAAVLDWSPQDGGKATIAVAAQYDAIALRTGDAHRLRIDSALFAAGWRRHPGGMLMNMSHEWSDDRLPHTSFYQRLDKTMPGQSLLRTGGAQADAAIARYVQASHHVRAGDHVLIDGRHAEDGAAILSAVSRAGTFTAVPETPAPQGEVFRLDAIADRSIDLIVAFDPPAENWQIALAEYARVLRLDGRIIVGWRSGGSGEAAPADWAALSDFAGQLFVIESRYGQNDAGRAVCAIDLAGPNSDWLILVAAADPLDGGAHRDSFTHPGFPTQGKALPVLVDFANAYDNPWLYRSMVQLGERIGCPITLSRLAECVITDSRADSADRGAAIAVLGYRVLEMRMAQSAPALIAKIEDYFAATQNPDGRNDCPPHVVRWRVSLAFLAARLCELIEDQGAALGWYDRAAGDDWAGFSPILATKTIGACFYAGRLCLVAGHVDGAVARFRRGVEIGQQVAAADHHSAMGGTEAPLPFYFQELAEVLDMASQCANALFHMPLWDRNPGLYWRQVDVRRFGLATWAMDMQRENERLRRMR